MSIRCQITDPERKLNDLVELVAGYGASFDIRLELLVIEPKLTDNHNS